MLQNELSDSALPQRPSRPHGPSPALILNQLAVDQGNQLPLHGPGEYTAAPTDVSVGMGLQVHSQLLDALPRVLVVDEVVSGDHLVVDRVLVLLDNGPYELQQGRVDGQTLDVYADGGLVEGALFAVEVGQASLAYCVAAAQADGAPEGDVKCVATYWTRQELRPLWSLNWHSEMQNHLCARIITCQNQVMALSVPMWQDRR